MKNIYLVTKDSYDGYIVLSVWDSEQKAESEKKRLMQLPEYIGSDVLEVQEFEVNKIYDKIEVG